MVTSHKINQIIDRAQKKPESLNVLMEQINVDDNAVDVQYYNDLYEAQIKLRDEWDKLLFEQIKKLDNERKKNIAEYIGRHLQRLHNDYFNKFSDMNYYNLYNGVIRGRCYDEFIPLYVRACRKAGINPSPWLLTNPVTGSNFLNAETLSPTASEFILIVFILKECIDKPFYTIIDELSNLAKEYNYNGDLQLRNFNTPWDRCRKRHFFKDEPKYRTYQKAIDFIKNHKDFNEHHQHCIDKAESYFPLKK
jgi:hypothetical protein